MLKKRLEKKQCNSILNQPNVKQWNRKKIIDEKEKKHQLTQWLESCEWNNLMEGKMRKLMNLNYKINKVLKDKIKKN